MKLGNRHVVLLGKGRNEVAKRVRRGREAVQQRIVGAVVGPASR